MIPAEVSLESIKTELTDGLAYAASVNSVFIDSKDTSAGIIKRCLPAHSRLKAFCLQGGS